MGYVGIFDGKLISQVNVDASSEYAIDEDPARKLCSMEELNAVGKMERSGECDMLVSSSIKLASTQA